MVQHSIQAIILAAGKSTRLNSGKSKLLEKICGQEMILYQTRLLQELHIPTTLVIGHQADQIKQVINRQHGNQLTFAYQNEQKGTGHALFASQEFWAAEQLLVLNGDMPLITKEVVEELINKHQQSNNTISFITAHNDDPTTQYGRVLKENNKLRIIEAREFTGNTHEACCINAGIYLINRAWLENPALELPLHGEKQEYYITDLVKLATDVDLPVEAITVSFDRVRGINTYRELWIAEQIKRSELISHWMNVGVRFYAAQSVHVEVDISIGAGTYIGCGVHVLNGTRIGRNCNIEAFTILDNAIIADNVTIYSHCVIKDSKIESFAHVGPFAHLRNQALVGEKATIGNFVEIKQSTVGKESKAKHLTYIGDATVGNNVNIGAGTITCNHNGIEKQKTVIEDHAYIGSNNTLVAPIKIGKNAFTAAGSVITETVPADALAIGRSRQVNKEHYAPKLKDKLSPIQPEFEEKPVLSFVGALKTDSDTQLT